MSDVTTAQRAETYGRDLGRCARCGSASPLTVQHRRGRGSGGDNRASNLLTLCGSGTTGCHGWTEANPAEADRLGYSVPPGEDPAEWPVEHNAWGRVLLLDDGGLRFLEAA